jgi:hypothetical protein
VLLAAVPLQAAESVSPEDLEVFLKVSFKLTGQDQLSETIARRTFAALSADDGQFPQQLKRLAGSLDKAPERWGKSEQALARKITKAWYLGIVGDGPQTEVVAYEHAQMYRSVADVLEPRTYCASQPGAWAKLPERRS